MKKNIKVSSFLQCKNTIYEPDDEKLYKLKRIEKIDFFGKIHLSEKKSNTKMIIIYPGELVISGINVSKGSISIYKGEQPVCSTIHFSSYVFNNQLIDIDYFKYFLLSEKFNTVIKQQVKGGIKTEIKPKHLLSLQFELPNKNDQTRIVKLYDKYNQKLSIFKNKRSQQIKYISKLKKKILTSAIKGNLTADWRLKNLKPDKIIKKNKLSLLAHSSWRLEKLEDLIREDKQITYGIIKLLNEPITGGVKVLRCSDIFFRKIEPKKIRRVSNEVSNNFRRTLLEGGEIVINIRGTLGGCAIVDDYMKDFNIAREVAVIPIKDKKLNNHILNVLTSDYFDEQIKNNLRGMGRKGLNLKLLKRMFIPIPSYKEQIEIDKKVKINLNRCENLEISASNIYNYLDKLNQNLINKFFN